MLGNSSWVLPQKKLSPAFESSVRRWLCVYFLSGKTKQLYQHSGNLLVSACYPQRVSVPVLMAAPGAAPKARSLSVLVTKRQV